MIETITSYSIVLIPILIFLITVAMKMHIGQDLHDITYAKTFLEIPVDLLFISVALTITFISQSKNNLEFGIIILLVLLLIAIISALMWRYSSILLTDEKLVKCGLIGILNYNLTIWPLIFIINLIVK